MLILQIKVDPLYYIKGELKLRKSYIINFEI